MRFILCWTCGYSTSVKGGGIQEVKTGLNLEEKHNCSKPNTEIITKE